MYYLVDPSDFIGERKRIRVETHGERRGQTAVTMDSAFTEILVIENVGNKAQQKYQAKMIDALTLADNKSPIN